MPSLRCKTTPADGPFVTVQVGITRPDRLRRLRAGLAVPQPITTTALLDTGAECTCVDPSIIQRLGLGWRNIGLVGVPAAGGLSGSTGYDVGFTIVHPDGDPRLDLVIPALAVEEVSQLAQFGVNVLIGRDVLASCVLVYDGPAGSVTLAY